MSETYQCPDGRTILLSFNEEDLSVEASNQGGETIGRYQFELIGPDGEEIDAMDDTSWAVWLKLAHSDLHDVWHHQGITERVMSLVAEETRVSPHDPSPS
ncbi:hypothetical protein [Plastoroseomonas arctica]|uniref:Uncharacterized protein n=1 Tax=Plastoroseomonas arctica TaxID=1509237 RepID=A0AAF1JYX7_9PROT|nr:hypothetical protein [Plastoroseomonas arctica]MBR0653660.1 hypothetical protein [Plastoroseomonas arctica]